MEPTQIQPNQQMVTQEEVYRQYGELCIQEKIVAQKKMILEQQIQQILNSQPMVKPS